MALDSPHTPQTPIYLTTAAAAERMELSVETVRDFCERGVLRDALQDHPRGPWRISVAAVEEWLQRNKPPPTDRPAPETSRQLEPSPQPIEHNVPPTAWERFRHHPWVFYPTVAFTIVAALVTVVTALISAGADLGPAAEQWRQSLGIRVFPRERDDEILIVIATFDRAEGVNDARPHIKIRDAIRNEADEMNFSHLRVEVELTVLATDARAQAETLGQRYNASIVIWGEETSVNVTVNFLNLKQPDFVAATATIMETERNFVSSFARPDPYSRFMNVDLPGQLTFLTLYAVGQSYYSSEAYTDAAATIERAIASLPPNVQLEGVAEAYYDLGLLFYVSSRDIVKALKNYNQAVHHNPNYTDAYNNRGVLYDEQGNYDAALADFNQAITLDPDDAMAYNNRGVLHGKQGNYDAALADFNQAITLDPDDAMAYSNRGIMHDKQDDYDAAIADYNQAIKLSPTYAIAYNNRGIVYDKQGDYDAAIADYNQAIKLSPTYAEAYNNRGSMYGDKDHYAEALADFNQAIKLDSSYASAYYNRGNVYVEQSDYVAAIADYTQAISLNPNDAYAYHNRGLAYVGTDNFPQSVADFEFFIAWSNQHDQYESERQQAEAWLIKLKAGENPFE